MFTGPRRRDDAVITHSLGNGSSPVCVPEEQGNQFLKATVLKLNRTPVTVANVTGASFGSIKLYDFPECRFQILGGRCDLVFDWSASSIGAAGSGDCSLGSTQTADATLGGTDVDMMASSAMVDPFVAGVGNVQGNLVKGTEFDGSATAKDLNLNVIIDDADVADAETDIVYVTGEVVVFWLNYGDHI